MVEYIAPVGDMSGYSQAARNNICALLSAGIEVTVTPVTFEGLKLEHGVIGDKIRPLLQRAIPTAVRLIHMTPDNYPRFINPNKYNIGYAVWETTRLPAHWLMPLNACNEVWTASSWGKRVFEENGVKCPVFVVPHPLDEEAFPSSLSPKSIEGLTPETYAFYSIFQWLERKAPVPLLIAYLTEFWQESNVCLVLKTYRQAGGNISAAEDGKWIRAQIANIKGLCHLEKYPPIRLITEVLSQANLLTLHQRGDCFVLPSRAEGWSLGHQEAMLVGKPTIGPRYGGNLDFMNDENSLLVDMRETPVFGMSWGHYSAEGLWGDPDILSLRKKMRWAYENREEAAKLGSIAQHYIRENFSWKKIGQIMRSRLEEIAKSQLKHST